MVIPFILTSPTDDDHAVSLIITQLGQFRPQYTTITRLRLRVHANGLQVSVGHFYIRFSPFILILGDNGQIDRARDRRCPTD